jgi:carbonic anhydrase
MATPWCLTGGSLLHAARNKTKQRLYYCATQTPSTYCCCQRFRTLNPFSHRGSIGLHVALDLEGEHLELVQINFHTPSDFIVEGMQVPFPSHPITTDFPSPIYSPPPPTARR